MKKVIVAVIIIINLMGIMERNTIFQEGNPIPVVVGILKLSLSGEKIAKISVSPEKYIIKNMDGYGPFIEFMDNKGWKYVEQMGAGSLFEKEGEKHTSVSRMFTRYYRVISY